MSRKRKIIFAGPDAVTGAPQGVMCRRALLAAGALAVVGEPLFGELPKLPGGSPVPLPSRIVQDQVAQVLELARWLGEMAHSFNVNPQTSSVVASRMTRLVQIPGTEPARRELLAALARLHLHAGWVAFDVGLFNLALHHYHQGLWLAGVAEDPYIRAVALSWAAQITAAHSPPDAKLTILKFAQVKA
ncbi:MAG: hypothetical protein ACT4NY_06635 [Pseudonocardiales bacterium]